jgi:ribosomal protein S18 acetylase RimI-like enzyme
MTGHASQSPAPVEETAEDRSAAAWHPLYAVTPADDCRGDGRPVGVDDRGVRIEPADEDDLELTSALHVAELPHGLFPRLGTTFVRHWHRAHAESSHGVLLVVRQGGKVVGFVLGTTDHHANVAWMIARYRRKLLISAVAALATRPAVTAHFVRTRAMRYARRLLRRPARSQTADREPVAVLEALVVAPAARRQAIGRSLVEAYVDVVAAVGTERADLVTKAGGAGAGAFYERLGWDQVGAHTDRDGDRVLTYRIRPGTPRKP